MSDGPGHGSKRIEARKPGTKATAVPRKKATRKKIPSARERGPELNMKHWHIQCSNSDLAMLCRKSDRTDRRCAVKESGRYRWTYGSYCDFALSCYKRACN